MSERASEPPQAKAATWLGFGLMCLGMFMAILDIQVVATSLPAIQNALAISRDAMSWIQTAYLIAEIIAIPLTGWLTRVLTLRWLFVAAIGLFTARLDRLCVQRQFRRPDRLPRASGLCRRHADPGGVFRGLPAVSDPPASGRRRRWPASWRCWRRPSGPVVGGWITETWSWHWLFLINVVPGIVAAVATPFLLPRTQPRLADLVTLDGVSLALMAIALACLEIGLKQAPHDGWLSSTCALLFAAQRRRDHRSSLSER